MKFLKNKAEWRKWATEHDLRVRAGGGEPPDPQSAKYPCFGYAIVKSWGYQEEQPAYLYREDVERMLKVL